jgi:hypothetical protein
MPAVLATHGTEPWHAKACEGGCWQGAVPSHSLGSARWHCGWTLVAQTSVGMHEAPRGARHQHSVSTCQCSLRISTIIHPPNIIPSSGWHCGYHMRRWADAADAAKSCTSRESHPRQRCRACDVGYDSACSCASNLSSSCCLPTTRCSVQRSNGLHSRHHPAERLCTSMLHRGRTCGRALAKLCEWRMMHGMCST